MNFKYEEGLMVAVESPKLGDFYGKIINKAPDGVYRNYLIVVTHGNGLLRTGAQAWVDEIYIAGVATEADAQTHKIISS